MKNSEASTEEEHIMWSKTRKAMYERLAPSLKGRISYDFEYLREWRIKGHEFDFREFPKEDLIVVAPDINKLNDLIVSHDVEFKPVFDYINGDFKPDWDEVFKREWKGFTVDSAENFIDDFAISASTVTQEIGQDMLDKLLASSPFYIGTRKNKTDEEGDI